MIYNRVLITGANGLLGQEVVTLMSSFPEYDVLATGRDAVPRFQDASCGYAPLDITSPQETRHIFQDFAPDIVINCAAMTQVDQCEVEREACWQVNVEAVEHLAKNCLTTGARLIQVSTDFVFDGQNGPYNESARPNPISFYGKSKLAAENAVRGAGLDQWSIARTVLVFGTGNRLSRSNFALWVIENLMEGDHIQVTADQWRTPTYAPDLAKGIERIVRFRKSGVFHLSGREFLSVYDFARMIAEVCEFNDSFIHATNSASLGQIASRPPRTGFIILKSETELGFKPRSLRTAIRDLAVRLGFPIATS